MIFETERLCIRFAQESDCEAITHYLQDEDVLGPLEAPPMPFAYSDAYKFYKNMIKTYDTHRPELFVLTEKSSTKLMGCIGLHPEHTFDNRADVAEFGYWMGKPFWRQGYMYEAAPIIIEQAFSKMGWVELVAQTSTDNMPSQNLLKKLGFAFLGERTRPTPPSRGTPTDYCWSLPLNRYNKHRESA